MEDDLKKIKMGPASPQIGLPSPVLPPSVDDQSDNDDIDNVSVASFSSTSTASSMPLSLSVASVAQQRALPTVPSHSHSHSHSHTQKRCHCVHAMAEAIVRNTHHDDDATAATRDSDLDSQAFYWNTSPPVMQHEYSVALDKALEKKSPKLFQLLSDMHIEDESVKIAIKELVTTPEKVSNILKRMHEGRARKHAPVAKPSPSGPGSQKNPKGPSASFLGEQINATSVGRDIQLLKKVAGTAGYFWKDGQLWSYPTADMHDRDCMADVELAKMRALETLMAPSVAHYHTSYTALRKLLRDVVTSGDYQFPPRAVVKSEHGETPLQPIFEARTPAQWLHAHLEMTSPQFNVQAFVKDSKLGPLDNEPQYFVDVGKAASFLTSFRTFVEPHERDLALVGRNLLFDLQKHDDLLARFWELTQSDDMMLLVHKLSVLLSKEAVLLRLWIHYNLPNLAMWLGLIETMERNGERCLVSPFFPSTSKKALFHRLTSLGVLDQETMPLVQALAQSKGDDASSEEEEEDEDEDEDGENLYVRAPTESFEDLRFSRMFARLFSRK
jgi:hypothetical protein